jgi:hypothetical protein
MALFTDASFTGVSLVAPFVGGTALVTPPHPNDAVVLQTSDGQAITVFDKASNALRCLEFMRQHGQWLLQPSDDVMIISVGNTKLLVMETTLINQKLITSFTPVYQGGRTLFAHRSMSQLLSLDDALQSVGFCKQTSTAFATNIDLVNGTNPTRIVLVDWYFFASPTEADKGSKLYDASPIVYDFVP